MIHKSEFLLYALIISAVIHFRIIFDMVVAPEHLTLLMAIYSVASFLTIISPGLILNIFAWRFQNRLLTLLTAMAYLNSSLYLSLILMWLLIPFLLCFYAFLTMKKPKKGAPIQE